MITLARNWDLLCLFCLAAAYVFNPRLKHRLHRISVPTQVVWGESDRIVTPDYGRALTPTLIPGADSSVIEHAGHHPEMERPDAFVSAVSSLVSLSQTSN